MKTVVEEREGTTTADSDALVTRIRQKFPRSQELTAPSGVIRLVVPLGTTGLQQIVVDMHFDDPAVGPPTPRSVTVRAYGKEGLLSLEPTARVANDLAQLLRE